MSFVERFIVLCLYLGESTIGSSNYIIRTKCGWKNQVVSVFCGREGPNGQYNNNTEKLDTFVWLKFSNCNF